MIQLLQGGELVSSLRYDCVSHALRHFLRRHLSQDGLDFGPILCLGRLKQTVSVCLAGSTKVSHDSETLL